MPAGRLRHAELCRRFGVVLLEALACRVPVIGSKVDGSREALLDGQLGYLVNTDVRQELVEAISHALTIVPCRKPNGFGGLF